MKNNFVAGLDLGTTKVGAIIAEEKDENLDILGFGVAPSEGLNRGLVANIAKTAEAIKTAMEIAQNRAGLDVKELNVGVAGEHIKSLRHRNYVTISNPDREITQEDLERLRMDVRTIRIPSDRQILHIIPEEFFVDNQGGVQFSQAGGRRADAVAPCVYSNLGMDGLMITVGKGFALKVAVTGTQ
jgi:cell division protein FtsA